MVLEGIMTGLSTAFTFTNILMVSLGVFAGTFIGILPGLGPISAIALMIPITYGFEPSSGLILMAGVYYGAVFGGSTSSILLNTPGEAATVATSFEGYPLHRQERRAKHSHRCVSSFSGEQSVLCFCWIAAPALAVVSLSFQSADYFALMVMGLTAVSAFAGKGQFLKAALMTILGVMLSTVGTDDSTGIQRFTLGQLDLIDGISFLLLAMATFALSEALISALKPGEASNAAQTAVKEKFGSLKVSKQEFKEMHRVSVDPLCWVSLSGCCRVPVRQLPRFWLTAWSRHLQRGRQNSNLVRGA